MLSLLFSLTLVFSIEESKPQLLRTLNCTATVERYEADTPVPNTKVDLKFDMKDYKSQITWSSDFKEDQYVTKLVLKGHPNDVKKRLYGEFAANGGVDDTNAERDGNPEGRDGWEGLTWYPMFEKQTRDFMSEEQEVVRLLLKSKRQQANEEVRNYTIVLLYSDEDGNETAQYGSENAVCNLKK